MNRFLPTAILIAALVAGGLLRAATVFTKPVFFHDESHSYQAATGHVGDAARMTYGKQPPYGRWAEARQWKRLLRPERPFCFVLISRDALAYDVHPPAYYWLLHLACLAVGTHYWTGTLLNAVLDLFTLFALYRFARCALGDAVAAAVAAFVWVVSPAALQVSVVEARMYSLLALIAVLFCDQLARFVHEPRPPKWRLPVLTLLTAAGALTHHHFAILVAGAIGWCAIGRITRERRRVVYAVGAAAAGYVLLVAVHPFFFGTGWKHLSTARLPTRAAFQARGRQTLESLAQLVLERRSEGALPPWTVTAFACVVPFLFAAAWWKLRRPRAGAAAAFAGAAAGGIGHDRPGDADPRPVGRYATAVGVWVAAVTVGLYLSGVTPAHAMAHRYLALAWPFVAIAVGVLLAPAPRPAGHDGNLRWRRIAVLTTCAVALFAGTQAAGVQWRNLDEQHPNAAEADQLVRNARRVVIDNVGRGHWPRPVWRLRDDAIVLIATPNDLLRRPAAWRRDLVAGTVYISPAQSATQTREKIVQSFGREHKVRHVSHLYGIGDVFLIE